MSEVKQTPYMHAIIRADIVEMTMDAVKNGFDGSMERTVAKRLQKDAAAGHSEAQVILESCEGDALKAAYLVTNSKIIS